MVLGPFDAALLTRGFSYYPHPGASALLDLLGLDEDQRVANMVALLDRSDPDEIEELARVFERALARRAEHRVLARVARRTSVRIERDGRDERPRRERRLSSAEWREERRREG